jgi:hypothetical protein
MINWLEAAMYFGFGMFIGFALSILVDWLEEKNT